jgi:FAD/FMN-containing dehydrogenase/Fe-S oxidoreductase
VSSPANRFTTELLQTLNEELQGHVEGEVRFDAWNRMLYATDASIYQIMPLGVVCPRSPADVRATIEACARHQIPILPRGGGSSLAGQTVGEAVVIDFSRHLDAINSIEAETGRVAAQPGISLTRLNDAVAGSGLMYGPDPASADRATVGGIVGNNSTGAHSTLYGMTVDHVQRLKVVLADGTPAVFEEVSWDEAVGRAGGNGREEDRSADRVATIYREVVRIAQTHSREIEEATPQTWRRVGGYNLDRIRPGKPVNLAHVVTGSEGTLCTILEADLGLVHRPPGTGLLVLSFDSLLSALATVPSLLEEGPSAVELLDALLIELCRTSPEYARRLTFVEGDPEAALIVEVYGESEQGCHEHLKRLATAAERSAEGAVGVRLISDPVEQDNVWAVRKAGLGLLMSKRGDFKPIPFIEDTAVPPDRLRAYIADVLEILGSHQTEAAFYAHASAGCLHIRPLINLKEATEVRKLEELSTAISGLVTAYGGAMSGEHGDGLARSIHNPTIFGDEVYGLFERLKDAFDPDGIMNPGKIVRAAPMAESLRFGPTYKTMSVATHFDFTADGGFDRLAEMCNGSGACRKLYAGTMCPSFQATREEEHSTRGRANALRAVLSGTVEADGLGDRRLFDTMDLCLSCKACRSECPSGVDLTRLKTEFLAHYHQIHGVPIRARLFGEIASVSRLGSALAPLSNHIASLGPLRALLERGLGIDRRRTLPMFHRQTFRRWFGRHLARDGRSTNREKGPRGDRPAVWLLPDTFTNHNEPHIGIAAVRLLEAAGVEVRMLPVPGGCCGRPQLSQGLVGRAQKLAERNVRVWSRLADARTPIVGLEPSCLLTLRDEYPDLVPGDASRRLADSAFMVEEWLDRESSICDRLEFRPPTHQDEERILIHGHCHQKALAGTGALERILSCLPGTSCQEAEAGCCGMAGSFGYEPDHYDLSMRVGSDRLFPAVEALGGQGIVAAQGTSCRHQIVEATGRKAFHPVEVLAKRLHQRPH